MPNAKLISAKDKAAELGISRATLSRRVKRGEIVPAYQGDGDNGIQLFTSTPSIPSSDVSSPQGPGEGVSSISGSAA